MGKLCVSSLEMMDVFLVSNGHAISGGSASPAGAYHLYLGKELE